MPTLRRAVPMAALVGAILFVGTPAPAAGQDALVSSVILTGVVEDRTLGTRVGAASLRLVREGSEGVFSGPTFQATTQANGMFVIPGLPAGRYQLIVEALGYEALDEEVTLSGDAHLLVALVPRALELDALVVLSRRSRYLEGVGFYQRREVARPGSTFTREEIRSAGGYLASDVLRGVPGVTLRRTRTGTPVILLRGGCRPDVVVDGINLGLNVLIDDVVRPADLEALEVHRGGSTFFPFSNSVCGSVAAWTVDASASDDGFPFSWRRFFTGVVLGGMIIWRSFGFSR